MKSFYEDNDILLSNKDWLFKIIYKSVEEDIYSWNQGIDALGILIENPYRILGLPSKVNSKETDKQYEKYLKKSKLGMEISTDFDFNILGKIDRKLEDLNIAYYKIQRSPHGMIWMNEPYFNDRLLVEACQKRFFKSEYNINTLNYDDFVVSFINLILNDSKCDYIYHWVYMLRMISLIYQEDEDFWNKIRLERTNLVIIDLSIEEMKEFYIESFLEPIFILVRQAIKRKNQRQIINWYHILLNASLQTQLIKEINIEIKDTLDDILEEAHKDLKDYFEDMIKSLDYRTGLYLITESQMKIKINKLNLLLDNTFKIIDSTTQKGKRIRKPLYEILSKIGGIYLQKKYYLEYRIIIDAAWKCVYNESSRLVLSEYEATYMKLNS